MVDAEAEAFVNWHTGRLRWADAVEAGPYHHQRGPSPGQGPAHLEQAQPLRRRQARARSNLTRRPAAELGRGALHIRVAGAQYPGLGRFQGNSKADLQPTKDERCGKAGSYPHRRGYAEQVNKWLPSTPSAYAR